MKIYLGRLREGELNVASSPLPAWQRLIDLSDAHESFTDDPASADRIIFVDVHQCHQLDLVMQITQHPLFHSHRQKMLVWNEMDRPRFDVRGMYVNVPYVLKNDVLVQAVPYVFVPADSMFYGTNFVASGRPITCTYRGTNTHRCRRLLTSINEDGFSLTDSSNENSIPVNEYLAELDKSIHSLCPRGHGLTSFRLYEAMARGCLPVIVADGWLPPKGIMWATFSTFVPESEVLKLPKYLDYSEIELTKRQASLKREYQSFLMPEIRMRSFLDEIANMPYGDCLSMSSTIRKFNIIMNVRAMLMSLKRRISDSL